MIEPLENRRRLLLSGVRMAAALFLGAGALFRWAHAAQDPRPEFAAGEFGDALESFFGVREASDDASIEIETPLEALHGELVPFRVSAPGVEKIALLTDANNDPMIMAMDQIRDRRAVMIGHARLQRSGRLVCYALRDGRLGRSERRVQIVGAWREVEQ